MSYSKETSRSAAGVIDTAARVLAPCYKQPDKLFVSGDGAHLTDSEGKHYIDMTSGIAVTALGHQSAVFKRAASQAAEGLVHTSNLFLTEPCIELAAALVEKSFADKVFFCNSGAEANEAAIKFARLYGGDSRRKIVFFSGSFHGRTLGALSATAKPSIQEPFRPLPEGFSEAPWNDQAAMDMIDEHTAAVIVEPIQGESGVRLADKKWLQSLRRRCDDVDALLIFDEVQVGLGRTGFLWAYESFGVQPDIMTLAKPLGGGLPIGAVLLSEKAAVSIYPGCHGTTFGGGPFVASVAGQIFKTVSDHEFLDRVTTRGEKLGAYLVGIRSPLVQNTRGLGLIWAIELKVEAAPIIEAAFEQGLLLVGAGSHTIRFLPPLNVSDDDLKEAVSILGTVLRAAEGEG